MAVYFLSLNNYSDRAYSNYSIDLFLFQNTLLQLLSYCAEIFSSLFHCAKKVYYEFSPKKVLCHVAYSSMRLWALTCKIYPTQRVEFHRSAGFVYSRLAIIRQVWDRDSVGLGFQKVWITEPSMLTLRQSIA